MIKVASFGQVVRQRVDVSPFSRPFPLLPLRRAPMTPPLTYSRVPAFCFGRRPAGAPATQTLAASSVIDAHVFPSPSPEVDDDRARQLIDDPTLDRIINAVGKPFEGNRNALRHDLLNCYVQFGIASGPGSSELNKRQVNRLTSISYHAKKLAELLQEDDGDLGLIRHIWPKRPDCPAYPLEQLGLLVALIEGMAGLKVSPGDLAKGAKARLGMSVSPLKWLISILLRAVYEQHFDAKAGKSRQANSAPTGPYIRFVHQVLDVFGIRCSDETIVRY